MIAFKKTIWLLSVAFSSLLICVPPSQGQTAVGSAASSSETENAANNSPVYGASLIGSGFPNPYKGHLLGEFSVGERMDRGILNGLFPTLGSPTLTDTEMSASFSYDLQQRHSDYLIDYRGSARHYYRFPQLDVLSHDLGLKQSVALGPRTKWDLNYRYTMTPDLAGSLMGETLASEMSFINPLPVAGIRGLPILGAPFQAILSPSDGLISLRSIQMTNVSHAELTHDLSYQTELVFQAGFSRNRFEDKTLFASNQYSVSAAIRHMLSERSAVGIGFQGGRMDLVQRFQQVMNEGIVVFLTKQLGRRTVLNLSGGPSQIEINGQQAVVLPTLLANLLARPTLLRNTSTAVFGWLGSASLSSNIHSIGFSLNYDRSVTDTGGLAGASLTQKSAVSVSREFRQRTSLTATASYIHFQVLGIINPIQMDQYGLTATFTRKLSRSVDFSTSFIYAKLMQAQAGPTALNSNLLNSVASSDFAGLLAGRQGNTLLNHNQVIVRFVYHFPRVNTLGSGA